MIFLLLSIHHLHRIIFASGVSSFQSKEKIVHRPVFNRKLISSVPITRRSSLIFSGMFSPPFLFRFLLLVHLPGLRYNGAVGKLVDISNTASTQQPVVQSFINLGIIIKSSELLKFKTYFGI